MGRIETSSFSTAIRWEKKRSCGFFILLTIPLLIQSGMKGLISLKLDSLETAFAGGRYERGGGAENSSLSPVVIIDVAT